MCHLPTSHMQIYTHPKRKKPTSDYTVRCSARSMYMLVCWFKQKTYHIYDAHHKRKRRGEVPILGDIHETSAIRTTLVALHLLHQSVLHYRLSQKQQLYLRTVNERLRSSAFAWTLSVGCRNLCAICIYCQICMYPRRQL